MALERIHGNPHKAASLKKLAQAGLERVRAGDRLKYPSHTLVDYYDIIHQLLTALALSEGVRFRGDGAHRELIDYAALPGDQEFLQQLREYRNRISYDGLVVPSQFLERNIERMERLISSLLRSAEEEHEQESR